jgi:ribosome-associated protein
MSEETNRREDALKIAELAAIAADDRKATDIEILDLTEMSDVTDYFVIVTTTNNPQTQAVVEHVEEVVKKATGDSPLSIEGRDGLRWVLLDYGCVVVHVMHTEARDYYRLERLWGDAPRVDAAGDMDAYREELAKLEQADDEAMQD